MTQPLTALLAGIVGLALVALVVWPRSGLWARLQTMRRRTTRVLIEDALKQYPARYMLMVMPFKEDRGNNICAVNHMGTGRLQTVRREWNPRYYRVIEMFGEATGVTQCYTDGNDIPTDRAYTMKHRKSGGPAR